MAKVYKFAGRLRQQNSNIVVLPLMSLNSLWRKALMVMRLMRNVGNRFTARYSVIQNTKTSHNAFSIRTVVKVGDANGTQMNISYLRSQIHNLTNYMPVLRPHTHVQSRCGVCVCELLFNGASAAKGHQRLDVVDKSFGVNSLVVEYELYLCAVGPCNNRSKNTYAYISPSEMKKLTRRSVRVKRNAGYSM